MGTNKHILITKKHNGFLLLLAANNILYKTTNLSLDDIILKGSFVHNVAMLLI